MTLDDLLRAAPVFHCDAAGEPRSYQISDDVLAFIDRHIGPASRTLEVGAGVSTVLFAMRGAEHVCVCPASDEVERIRAWCAARDVDLARVRFEIATSTACLPELAIGDVDLVLIDGAHGFPTPFIDWYYAERHLRPGGHLVVDDTHVWTGHVLRAFLASQPEWRLAADHPPRCAIFEKLAHGSGDRNEWHQPFVVEQTLEALRAEHLPIARPWVAPEQMAAYERRRRTWRYRLGRRLLR